MNKTSINRAFILGNPRSGTSLLRIMLNAHPEILATPECGFMQWWYDKYQSWSIDDSKNETRVKSFVSDLLTSKKIEFWGLGQEKIIKSIQGKLPRDYGELCDVVFLDRADIINKVPKAIIDKNNYYIHHLELLKKIWPNAKYVFMVRDGRDVACSYLALTDLESNSDYKPNLSSNIEEIAKEWNENNKRINLFLNENYSSSFILVKYEDILLDLEKELKRVVEFFNLEFNANMLEYYKHNDEPAGTLDWKKNTLNKPMVDNIGKYKKLLVQDEIKIFNTIANKTLKMFNYE